MILWLVGMMGTGKTTCGRLAADFLGVEFHDTDAEVAKLMGCSISQLWGDLGEKAFRDMERASIRRMSARAGIVATGGGAPLDAENRRTIRGVGRCLWLRAGSPVITDRLESVVDRPLLGGAEYRLDRIEALLSERSTFYQEVSDHVIDTDMVEIGAVVDEIVHWWRA